MTITAPGYGITATLDGDVLTVEGHNKAFRIALAGEQHGDGPVVLRREQIANVHLKKANPVVNGNLVVMTTDGRKYQLHFRRKHSDGMTALAAALGA